MSILTIGKSAIALYAKIKMIKFLLLRSSPLTNSSDEISQLSISEDPKNHLIAELKQLGIKHSPERMLRIARLSDGKIVFLEEGKGGERGSGLQHILEKHLKDFANRGISQEQIPDAIITAIIQGNIVGNQPPYRPIYRRFGFKTPSF
jgi:hypothetical protein